MVEEFASWGNAFNPNRVAFQVGYEVDGGRWLQYPDPAKTIGEAILARVPNTLGLFWVEFTVTRIFPLTNTTAQTIASTLTVEVAGSSTTSSATRLGADYHGIWQAPIVSAAAVIVGLVFVALMKLAKPRHSIHARISPV